MNMRRHLLGCALLVSLFARAAAAGIVGYQGRVVVDGTNYNGVGYFKFAIVNSGESITRWSNDGTSVAGSEPSNAVQLAVSKGLFSAELGNTLVPNMTSNITPSVLAQYDTFLKVWFSSDNATFIVLSPNLRLPAGSAHAVYAEEALAVKTGNITSSMIGEGQVTGFNVQNGSLSGVDLANNSLFSDQLGTAAVGSDELAGGAVTADKIASGAVSALGSPNGSATNVLVTDNSGRVGIGVTTMTNQFVVAGTVQATAYLGDGSQLTGLPQSTNVWKLAGNAGTAAGANFIGTTDTNALELRVNGARALRIETASTPNLTGGYSGNAITNGFGAVISGGGGGSGSANFIGANFAVIAGGSDNRANGESTAIGGGNGNRVSGYYSVIAGGSLNTVTGDDSVVSGGTQNHVGGVAAAVPGGQLNSADGWYSFAAGRRAKATNDGTFVWGDNTATDFSSTAANQFLIRAGGGVGIGTNSMTNALVVAGKVQATGFVGDGSQLSLGSSVWTLTGNAGTTTGTHFIGTTDSKALDFRVNNARALRLEPGSSPNLVGGYSGNAVTNSSIGVTIEGGGSGNPNYGGGDYATIGGGRDNRASGLSSVIGGGESHRLNGYGATISGGIANTATGDESVVSGGSENFANGVAATVPGGFQNRADGGYSFAAGRRAKATNEGAFVWADRTDADFASTATNQFLIRASGGVGIGTNAPAASLHVTGSERLDGAMTINHTTNQILLQVSGANNIGTWVALDNTTTGGRSWRLVSTGSSNGEGSGHLLFIDNGPGVRMMISSNGNVGVGTSSPTNKLHVAGTVQATAYITGSDRAMKDHITPAQPEDILAKVAALPIATWTFKDDPSGTHMGPMAQDFHAAFGLGNTDSGIFTVDADGVALASIQGLYQLVQAQQEQMVAQQREIEQLRAEIESVKSRAGSSAR